MTVGDARVSWLSHSSANTTFLSKATDYFFSHATAEVRGENTPERKVASTGNRTDNHQVMSPTRSPLSHLGWARLKELQEIIDRCTCRRDITEMQ